MVVSNCFIPKHDATAVKNLETNCGQLLVSRYVSIPYRSTKWSSITVLTFVNITVLTCHLTSLSCRAFKTISVDFLISPLLKDQEWSLP